MLNPDPPTINLTIGLFIVLCLFAWFLFWHHFDKQRADNE